MKVFLSWSGDLSHKVALAFRDWLPSVIQSLEPYVSSEDIEKGARWTSEMAEELEKSRYGIIFVTKENINKPWLNFEAGALSKTIERSSASPFSTAVSPFLFDLKSSDLEGPLTQFQYVVNERDDISKLTASINAKIEVNQLSAEKLTKSFERWWPDLAQVLNKISSEQTAKPEPKKPARKPDEILDELLELARSQQRGSASKDDISSLAATLRLEIAGIKSYPFATPISGGVTSFLVRDPNWFEAPNVSSVIRAQSFVSDDVASKTTPEAQTEGDAELEGPSVDSQKDARRNDPK